MLTAKRVERTTKPGRYRDGIVKGLLLQISKSGAKSFVLRFELNGHERMMGLGSASEPFQGHMSRWAKSGPERMPAA